MKRYQIIKDTMSQSNSIIEKMKKNKDEEKNNSTEEEKISSFGNA